MTPERRAPAPGWRKTYADVSQEPWLKTSSGADKTWEVWQGPTTDEHTIGIILELMRTADGPLSNLLARHIMTLLDENPSTPIPQT